MLLKEKQVTQCAHCGESCEKDAQNDLSFCCNGCEQIYLLLSEHDLGKYYDLEQYPGLSNKKKDASKSFAFLDKEETISRIISFQDQKRSKVHFTLPDIHCSSCLWLLENLHRLNDGIHQCKINFLEKKAYITFDHQQLSLRSLVELLYKIGYEPELNFANLDQPKSDQKDRSLLLKIGVAGFAFGNIMLFSFPEYLGFNEAYKSYFLGYINIALALPVIFYSGWEYLKRAYQDLERGHLGIHVPLAIGIITLFSRSLYEIISGTGEGYLDSFAGFILFLLIGKWFQIRTQRFIEFDRDYRSYFPISISVLEGGQWVSRTIDSIGKDDTILIKNEEVIPCDGILLEGKAKIDYSFVTGETDLQDVKVDERIFAGGKHIGSPITINVEKPVEQGYLTQLWNESTFKEVKPSTAEVLLNQISKYFTLIILMIAAATFAYWQLTDPSKAYQSVTAVLIVACPCALALSVPFLLGSAMRVLAKMKFYVKSIDTLERLSDVDTIIFDKTGTITENKRILASFHGQELNSTERDMIFSLAFQSSHPLSTAIAKKLDGNLLDIDHFQEHIGQGVSGHVNGCFLKLGSPEFIFHSADDTEANVIVEIDGKIKGNFTFSKPLRPGIKQVLKNLDTYKLALLSGDTEREQNRMELLFPKTSELKFRQKPKDKLQYIQSLQEKQHTVMMVGDGLNDAGALKQSDVGIVIVDDNNTFSPACDVIMTAEGLSNFTKIQTYFKLLKKGLYGAFVIAFLYNIIGLTFAVSGQLSPLIAAILMPVSSITIILYSLSISRIFARRLDLGR